MSTPKPPSSAVECAGCSHAEAHHQSESTACEWTTCGCPRFLPPPPVQHFRTGPARCNCGFDAYKLRGIMLDYAELFDSHMRRVQAAEHKAFLAALGVSGKEANERG